MPIYEYACTKCNSEFELRLLFSESDKAITCPKCKAPAQKLYSSFGCKTGGNIQAAEKPFRKAVASGKGANKETNTSPATPSVLITPPLNRIELLSPPEKRSIREHHKKK